MNFGFVMLCVIEDCEGCGRNVRADDKVIATPFNFFSSSSRSLRRNVRADDKVIATSKLQFSTSIVPRRNVRADDKVIATQRQ